MNNLRKCGHCTHWMRATCPHESDPVRPIKTDDACIHYNMQAHDAWIKDPNYEPPRELLK